MLNPFDQIETWRGSLLDTSKRNPMIGLKVGSRGAIELLEPSPAEIWERIVVDGGSIEFPPPPPPEPIELEPSAPIPPRLQGGTGEDSTSADQTASSDDRRSAATFPLVPQPRVPEMGPVASRSSLKRVRVPGQVVTSLGDKGLATRLNRLAENAKISLTEQGVPTLFLAFGALRWFESPASEIDVYSPLVLFPVKLHRDDVASSWTLSLHEDEPSPNYSLGQLLKNDFNLTLPELPSEEGDAVGWRDDYFDAVRATVKNQTRWEVVDRCCLGIFSYQKIAMWKDLGDNKALIAEHRVCGAMAGGAAADFTLSGSAPSAAELDDKISPLTTFQILEADSSQQEAIEAVKAGDSLIVDGPPGTGKSQTIANLIAEFLALGKTVLFVSEKAAALEVVKRRLDQHGLGDFCLELHSHKANKIQIIQELGRSLQLAEVPASNRREALQRLEETRRRLNAYVRALHLPREPLGLSVFDVQARLAALGDPKPTHCPISDARVAVQATLRRRTAILDGLKDYEALLADPAGHPWRGVRESGRSLTLVDEVRRHLHQIAAGLPSFREIVDALESAGWQRAPSSMAHWLMQTRRVVQAASYPLIPLAWFAGDPREIATAYVQLDEATKSYRTARTTAAEFSEEKVLRAAPALFDALQRLRTSPRQVAPFQSKSLRKMCDFLQPLLERLKELLARLAAAQSSFEDFCQVVRVAPRQVPVREWEQYKAIQGLLDERVRPCREWFESAGRKELRRDADQCRELNRQAAEARDFLSERLSSKAFAPETAALAVEAAKYTSFWRRWLPSWRRVREQLTGLYRVAVPELSILLADIARLRDYHRHKGSARRVSDERAADVALDELGAPDWERTIAPLAVVESLDTVWATFPDLQAAFATNAFDRRLAAAALATFEQHHAAFTSAVAALGPSFGLPHVFQSEHPRGRSTAAMLTAALNEERVVWEGVLQAAVSLRSLLQDGGDLAVSTLETKLASLDALRSSAAKIRSIAGLLPLSESDRVGVRDRDWSSERKAGEWLVRFLHEHANQPPQELLDAVRRPDARAKLSAVAARVADLEERGFFTAWDGLMRLFGDERTSLGGRIADASLEALGEWLAARQSDVPRILEWTGLNELRRQAAEGGVDAVVVGAMEKQFAANEATSVYLAKFFRAWLDHVQSQTPELNGLGTETPDRIVAQFRELDRDAIDLASGRVRATLLNAPDRPRTSVGAPRGSELGILLGEVGKKQRHMPLRKLFAGTPTLLPRLKPCLMMSPLAVSTYLSAGDFKFDLVVIDEASQVRPHDAVAAVYRGKQLVVAGDQKQLPPTSFFERASTVDDDEDAEPEDQMADFESILDVCTTLGVPRRRLRWHYRSRREPLIAFSNRHIYDAELVTFPSVEDGGDPPAVRFEYVADGRWKSGSGNAFNPIEARRTAELVVEHFRRSPDQTLGVIAFSRRQQIGITDELERLRRKDGSLEQFFSDERDEPFFVKNLENVQGDERDAIFLSIGYGPDDHGRIAMRFGPLNLKGGERRLNVAVTRARESMTVVSSLKAQDIDLSRTDAVGAKLLRAYLDFAERGVEAFGTETTAGDEHAADSPFEVEVARALTQRGLIVRRQVGCSSYRIDLAVVDPDRPGRFLLGVECDGATYHSSKTARDRDRIRQEILESLGWSMLRIWSTDWIRNPASQVERVLAAVEQAKRTPPQFRKATPQVVATVVKPAVARAVARPKPTAADAASKTAAQCKSIDDVREHVLEKVVLERLGLYGTTQPDELIQAVSRELGFQRTGPRIKARVEATIEQLVTSGRLVRVEGGVRKSSS